MQIAGKTAEQLMRPFGEHVAATPANLAPEKQGELGALYGGPPWEILFSGGDANFVAVVEGNQETGGHQIIARYAGLLGLWSTVQAVVAVTDAAVIALNAGRKTIPSDPASIYGMAQRYVDYARMLVRDANVPFPEHLESPDVSSAGGDALRVNNLFYGAVGWILLHEIGHIHLKHQRIVTDDISKQQENEADRFATDWILSGSGIPQPHREFRIFAVAAAMQWLGLVDQVRRGSTTHPHTSERLGRCRAIMSPNDDSPGLEPASYMLKAIFLPSIELPESEHAAFAFDEVLYAYSQAPREVIVR